jgi:hypothetical protein
VATWPEARAAKVERLRREAAQRSPKAKAREPAPWRPADLALVVCKGGPRAGTWYTTDWWHDQRAHASVFGHQPTDDGDTILGYVHTGNTVDHPRFDGPDGDPLTGTVLLWNPTEAAARQRRKR